MPNKERYLNIGLNVGQFAPEFVLEGRKQLSLNSILKYGPLVLVVSHDKYCINSGTMTTKDREGQEIRQINKQGGSYLKIIKPNNNLQCLTTNTYNKSAIIYIIDRKRLICYKKELDNYRLHNEIEEILAILNFIS